MVAKRGYHHGDLRTALLSEAIEIILESGTAALSLRWLARRVGVSPAAYAYHFPDKSSLLIAIGSEGFRRLNEAFEPAAAIEDPAARLVALGRRYLDFAVENSAHYRVMFFDHPTPKAGNRNEEHFLTVATAAFEALRSTVAELMQQGSDNRNGWERALMMWAQIHGAVSLWLEGLLAPGATEAQAIEQLRTLIDHAAQEQAKLLQGAGIYLLRHFAAIAFPKEDI